MPYRCAIMTMSGAIGGGNRLFDRYRYCTRHIVMTKSWAAGRLGDGSGNSSRGRASNRDCAIKVFLSHLPHNLSHHSLMSTDIWVLSYENLKGHPRSDQALTLLQKIASRVKPIMRKHSWRLPVLAEFFPDDPGLIGMLSAPLLPQCIISKRV